MQKIDKGRRTFGLHVIGATAVTILAPSLASLKVPFLPDNSHLADTNSIFTYAGGISYEAETELGNLFLKEENPFEALANDNQIDVGEMKLPDEAEGLVKILDSFSPDRRVGPNPSFQRAAQCYDCFKNAKQDFESKGVGLFSDVLRPQQEPDVAAFFGAQKSGIGYGNAKLTNLATQYGRYNAVKVSPDDVGSIVVAATLMRNFHADARNLLAHLHTLMGKAQETRSDGEVRTVYWTPLHTVAVQRYAPHKRTRKVGRIVVQHKGQPSKNKPITAELFV